MHIFLIAVMSADGYIGRSSDDRSLDWTSKEDTAFFVKTTKNAGAVVMGSTTLRTVKHPMPHLSVYAMTSNADRVKEVTPVRVTPIFHGPEAVIKQAKQDGFTSLAVCGGSSVYTQFLEAGLVDTIFLTIEPILFGSGVRLFSHSLHQKLSLVQVHHLSDQVKTFEYHVLK